MLEHKGVPCRVVNFLPGFHPLLVRAAGFRGGTVPALRVDGRRVQGSLQISRTLDELKPEPALFPADPERRARVEKAERWGDVELQPVPRRIFRWMLAHRPEVRRWMAAEVGMPAPGLMATVNAPLARRFARVVDADDAHVRADLDGLGATLDRVDALIADGTIGGDEPNAADFQIASSVRSLLALSDLEGRIGDRPATELARRLFPDYPGTSVPPALPQDWLPAPF